MSRLCMQISLVSLLTVIVLKKKYPSASAVAEAIVSLELKVTCASGEVYPNNEKLPIVPTVADWEADL